MFPFCWISISIYRTRWNYLLSTLEVPTSSSLAPGGLRGGGAVESYRRGLPIADICRYTMVHEPQESRTLESYLQEVAALSALTQLGPSTLASIRASARMFQFLR